MLEAEKDAADRWRRRCGLEAGCQRRWRSRRRQRRHARPGSGGRHRWCVWRAARPGRRSENVSRDPRGARSLSVGRGGV